MLWLSHRLRGKNDRIDRDMELISRWRRFPSFATFATPEVVAEMVDMRTLDGCKDTMFEARAMFEVVEEVLDVDEQRLDVGSHGPRKDTERKDNIVNGFNDVASRMRMLDARGMTIDFHAWSRLASSMTFVDFNAWRIDGDAGCEDMLTKGVDRCNGVAGRMRVFDARSVIIDFNGFSSRMTLVDLRRKDNIVDGCNDIASRMRITVIDNGVDGCKDISSRITVVDNEIWSGLLTKSVDRCEGMLTEGVDGCNDIASKVRTTVINGELISSISSKMTVIDDELWLKYSLRRCLISSRITVVDK